MRAGGGIRRGGAPVAGTEGGGVPRLLRPPKRARSGKSERDALLNYWTVPSWWAGRTTPCSPAAETAPEASTSTSMSWPRRPLLHDSRLYLARDTLLRVHGIRYTEYILAGTGDPDDSIDKDMVSDMHVVVTTLCRWRWGVSELRQPGYGQLDFF